MDAIERGNLAQKAVLPLLADLYQQDATGSLRLERAPLQKAVYFRDGQILFAASNDPKDQLASILVEEGKLSPDQMQVARARVSAGNPLAKVLTELGYISQRELADAARLKVEKILTDLFTWKEGTYQFAEKSLPKGAIDLELSTQRLLFNSIRRIEDRTWILEEVGSMETVLSPTESLKAFIEEAEPDDKALKVVRAVDGTRTIKQISDSSELGDFEVSKIVVAALTIGAFRKGAAEPETAAISIPADEEAFSVEAADVISFQVSDPGDEEEPLEQTIVEADAAPFAFSQEEPEALSAPPEPEAPLMAPETLPPLVPSESQPPLVPSESQPPLVPPESQPPLVPPESQPPLVSPEPEASPVSPDPQPPLVFPESQPPLISPEPPPPFESSSVSGLLIDEPEADAVEQAPQRTPPRPRHAGRAPEGGAGKKVLVSLAAILLLVGGGLAGYFFIWPMFSSDQTTGGTETPSSSQPAGSTTNAQSPPSAAPGAAGTSGSASGSTPTAPPPATGRPGQSQPTTPGRPQSPAPSAAPTTPTPKPGSTRPSPTTPPPTAKPPTRPTPKPAPSQPKPSPAPSRPATGSSTDSQELLINGQYPAAARSYLQQLRGIGNNKFTIAVGMYCDVANVGRAFRDSGNSSSLIVLPYQYQGRSCYRVFWGLYDSQEAARQNLASVPAAIRSPQSVPVPTSRLTR